MSRIQVKEHSKRIWIYSYIPMYATIGGISVYVRGYQGKIRVYHFSYIFRDDQGHIKRKKWSIGANESAAGQGKAIQCAIHLVW